MRLSQRTNEIQHLAQKAQCDAGATTTDTGAWCRDAVNQLHMTDLSLAAALAQLFGSKTVLSLGDGRGEYRALILNSSSQVSYVTAVLISILFTSI